LSNNHSVFSRARLEGNKRVTALIGGIRSPFCQFANCEEEEFKDGLCDRHYARLKKYKMTVNQFNQMFEDQSGMCGICEGAIEPDECHIDHDHNCCRSGASCGSCVRELLCRVCNLGMSHPLTDIAYLESAIQYLKRHPLR